MASVNSDSQVYQRSNMGADTTNEDGTASFNGRQTTETTGIAYIKQRLQDFARWFRDLSGRIQAFFITHCRCCTCSPDPNLLIADPTENEETDIQSDRRTDSNRTAADVIVDTSEDTRAPATTDAVFHHTSEAIEDIEPAARPDCMSQLPDNKEPIKLSITSDMTDEQISPLPPENKTLCSKEMTLSRHNSFDDLTIPVWKADDEIQSLNITIKSSPAPIAAPSIEQDQGSVTNSAVSMTSSRPLSVTSVEHDKPKDHVQTDEEITQPACSSEEAIDSPSPSNTEGLRQTNCKAEQQCPKVPLLPVIVTPKKSKDVLNLSIEQDEFTEKQPNQASQSQHALDKALVSPTHSDPEDNMDADNHSDKTVVSEQHSPDSIWKDFDADDSRPYHSRPYHSLKDSALKRHTLSHTYQSRSVPNLTELSDSAHELRLYEPLFWSDNEEELSGSETEDDLEGTVACSTFNTSDDVEKTLSDSSTEDDISDAATASNNVHTSTSTEATPSTSQPSSTTLTRESPEYETILKFLIYAAGLSGRTKHDKANQIDLKEILKIHPFSSSKLNKRKGRRIKSKHIRTLRENPAAYLGLCRFIVCSRTPLGYAAKNLTLYRELAAGHTVTLEEANRRFPIEAPNIPDPEDPDKTIPDIETTKKIQAIMIPVRKRVLEILPDLEEKDLSNSQQLVELIIYKKIVAAYFLLLDQIIEEEPQVQPKMPKITFRPFSKAKEVDEPKNLPHLNVKAIKDFVECEWEKKQLELLIKNEELSDQQILDCIKRTNRLIEDIEKKLEKYEDNELPTNFKAICRGNAAKEELDGATTIPELKRKLLKVFQDRATARGINF